MLFGTCPGDRFICAVRHLPGRETRLYCLAPTEERGSPVLFSTCPGGSLTCAVQHLPRREAHRCYLTPAWKGSCLCY